ncbi:DUF3237 domain-containing protein [Arthrobacter crystallopoietes]|uniref:DUF3237 domain-containing protein n=1 Tax=Crystallibacter crystallopoietes TaxID=37928 RepID=UPI001ABE7CDE|nr:DUF3237 domain-containing protein [Arthrobacter crystallopoietes]QTG82087.1 DUF3237 domain-containing protein [Arthrobacter crystallopoietes]
MTSTSTRTAAAVAGPVPALRYAFTIVARVDPYIPLMGRAAEQLELIPITGGHVSGELAGDVVAGGADWCTARADDAFQVEARYGIRTQDGHYVDVVNTGILRHLDGETGDSQHMGYFMTSPVFRTAAPELQWLTRSAFVGRARVFDGNTSIDVYEITA